MSKEKKKLLLVSYIFPPFGGGGAPRLSGLARYLVNFGYATKVLTVKTGVARGYDYSLLDGLPSEVEIYRTGSADPRRVLYVISEVLKKFKRAHKDSSLDKSSKSQNIFQPILGDWINRVRSFFVPDEVILWVPFALVKAVRLVSRDKIKLVLTSSSPHSVQLVGLLLKKLFGVKWVADFRDAWAEHPNYIFPTRIHKFLAHFLERKVMENADRVVFAYGYSEACKRYPELAGKFELITNGYDEEDFQGIVARSDEGFNLVYVGAFYSHQTPRYFLYALRELLNEDRELKRDIKVSFIGAFNPEHIKLVEETGLEDVVKLIPFLPHNECMGFLVGADVLLLFVSGKEKPSIVIPAKVFEYIRAGAWILGMVPEGETKEILEKAGGSIVVEDDDVEGIKNAIRELYKKWRSGEKPVRDYNYVRSKERNALIKKYALILDEIYEGG